MRGYIFSIEAALSLLTVLLLSTLLITLESRPSNTEEIYYQAQNFLTVAIETGAMENWILYSDSSQLEEIMEMVNPNAQAVLRSGGKEIHFGSCSGNAISVKRLVVLSASRNEWVELEISVD